MKFLFATIIFFLLLTPPLIGDSHKEEVFYRWETSSGIVWKGFGDKDIHDLYEGELENGKLHGLGIMKYVNGNKYVGEWKDGKKHGLGTHNFPNGSKYVGEWKNGEQNGKGTWTHDETKYVGEWKDGKTNGQGTYNFPDGESWVGEWKNNKHWNTEVYDLNGEIIRRYVNGALQE